MSGIFLLKWMKHLNSTTTGMCYKQWNIYSVFNKKKDLKWTFNLHFSGIVWYSFSSSATHKLNVFNTFLMRKGVNISSSNRCTVPSLLLWLYYQSDCCRWLPLHQQSRFGTYSCHFLNTDFVKQGLPFLGRACSAQSPDSRGREQQHPHRRSSQLSSWHQALYFNLYLHCNWYLQHIPIMPAFVYFWKYIN